MNLALNFAWQLNDIVTYSVTTSQTWEVLFICISFLVDSLLLQHVMTQQRNDRKVILKRKANSDYFMSLLHLCNIWYTLIVHFIYIK